MISKFDDATFVKVKDGLKRSIITKDYKRLKPGLLTIFLFFFSFQLIAQETSTIYHGDWIDFNKNGEKDVYEDVSQPVEHRIKDLVSQMNLKEKACQLATLYGYGAVLKDPLPTPDWKNKIWINGIANIDEHLTGLRKTMKYSFPYAEHQKAINKIQRFFVEDTRLGIPVDFTTEGLAGLNHAKATFFPREIAQGCTFDSALVYAIGEVEGKEAKILGYTNIYAPEVDVSSDPRWGRVVSCYSSSPYLVGRMGDAMIKGIQSQGVAST